MALRFEIFFQADRLGIQKQIDTGQWVVSYNLYVISGKQSDDWPMGYPIELA